MGGASIPRPVLKNIGTPVYPLPILLKEVITVHEWNIDMIKAITKPNIKQKQIKNLTGSNKRFA